MRFLSFNALLVGLTYATQTVAELSPRDDQHGCEGFGVYRIEGAASECCVGGHLQTPYLSTCAGWPICTGSVTTTVTKTPMTCATVVTYAVGNSVNPDYSSQLSAAKAAAPSASATANPSTSATANAAASGSSTSGSGGWAIQLGLVGGAVLGLAILL